MADWYYLKDGEQQGPLEDEALLDAVAAGTVAHTDLIWCEGMDDWLPAADLMEFEEEEGAAPAAAAATAAAPAAAAATAAPAAAAASDAAWYYLADGEQTGPVSLEQLGALCADGTLSSEDLIWTESLGDWKAVSEVEAVSAAASGAAPAAAPKKAAGKTTGRKKTVVKKVSGKKAVKGAKSGGKKAVAAASAGAVAAGATAAAAATATGASGSVGATPDDRDGHWVYPGFKWLITSFKGRIPRKKFWVGMLLLYVLMLVLMIPSFVMFFLSAKAAAAEAMSGNTPGMPILAIIGGILMFILLLVFIFFSLAIQVKRWHDRGKSGWWVLTNLIPVPWALIENGFLEGTVGPNKYGPDPLGRK